jgi:hypothetical protein
MSKRRTRLPETLPASKAIDRMRTGSRLLHMHGSRSAYHWYVTPGGPVTDAVASEIKSHPAVVGAKDGLFPGHDQTWRMRSFVQQSA